MQAKGKRILKDGKRFDALFPRARMTNVLKVAFADTEDTVKLVETVIDGYAYEAAPAAKVLQGRTLEETCRNIWNFCYDHIQYCLDPQGKEWIRTPARIWHDRVGGDDCDGYATMAGAMLRSLGIVFHLRVTRYKHNWQHIYVVVPRSQDERQELDQARRSEYIVIDPVVDQFDFEVPYSGKMDTKDAKTMNAYLLGGIEDWDDDATLSGKKSRERKAKRVAETVIGEDNLKKRKGFGKLLQKVGRAVQKVNPVALVLRNAVLAAMKVNFRKIAQRLRYGYLTQAQATANYAMTAQQWKTVRDELAKVQNTFVKAGGGSAQALKNAILKGKGNRQRPVPLRGLEGFYDPEFEALAGTEDEVYYWMHPSQETIAGIAGLGSLGEPVTLTLVGAAAALLSSVGAILDKIMPHDPSEESGTAEDLVESTDSTTLMVDSSDLEGLGAVKAKAKAALASSKKKPAVVKKAVVSAKKPASVKKSAVVAKKPLVAKKTTPLAVKKPAVRPAAPAPIQKLTPRPVTPTVSPSLTLPAIPARVIPPAPTTPTTASQKKTATTTVEKRAQAALQKAKKKEVKATAKQVKKDQKATSKAAKAAQKSTQSKGQGLKKITNTATDVAQAIQDPKALMERKKLTPQQQAAITVAANAAMMIPAVNRAVVPVVKAVKQQEDVEDYTDKQEEIPSGDESEGDDDAGKKALARQKKAKKPADKDSMDTGTKIALGAAAVVTLGLLISTGSGKQPTEVVRYERNPDSLSGLPPRRRARKKNSRSNPRALAGVMD